MDNIKILIVDDDPDYTDLITDILEDDYALLIASSGSEAVQKFDTEAPDLILLDINMPDMNGYDACEAIKKHDIHDNAAIIFVSGTSSIAERIQGYDAGGDDYITKPFQVAEFKNKIAATARFQQAKKNLASKEKYARSMVFESMKEASQYGQVLQFLKTSFSCDDIHGLSHAIFNLLTHFGLNSCLQIRTPSETRSLRPNNNACSPMEIELFELLRNKGRLYNFDARMMINDAHVSVLIKNMPTDDDVQMGRLRDVLAVIIEGVNARIIDLERKQTINVILNSLTTTISRVRSQFHDHQKINIDIMDKLLLEMGSSLHVLDLTDQQEQFFMKLVQTSMVELVGVCESGRNIEDEIDEIAGLINPLVT